MSDNQRHVAMITGGNSGIGFATATKLAMQGFHVILASRNQQASAQAITRILAGNPNAAVESIPLIWLHLHRCDSASLCFRPRIIRCTS